MTQQKRKVVYIYIDVKQLYEDAKVAGVLCIGGPVKYALKQGIEIGDAWLFENVIPCIRQRFTRDAKLCRVLARSLLYACLKDDIMVPDGIRNRIKAA